jgi:hypothetical protein
VRNRVGLASLWSAVAAACVAAVILLSGGLTVRGLGVVLHLRGAARPAIAALVLLAGGLLTLAPADRRLTLRRAWGTSDRRGAIFAALVTAAVFIVAAAWNTRAVGGSDSSCYVLQAMGLMHGNATLPHPLAGALPGEPPELFAPSGFIPAPTSPYRAAPICSAGLAVLMAPLVPFGETLFLVIPMCAALAVWLTFLLARRLGGPLAGACAAIVTAASPIFLYQSIQPMSDVPATAFWLAALVALARRDPRGDVIAGVCLSMAILTRVNLLLTALPLVLLLRDRRAWLRCAGAAAPGFILMAVLNELRYGAPLASGYGAAGGLFALAHVAPNAGRYASWLVTTQSPLVFLAVAAPFVLRDRASHRLAGVILVSSALVACTYLSYTVFDDWWYVRFLLPILPPLTALATAGLFEGGRRLGVPAWGLAPVFVILACWEVQGVLSGPTFDLQRLEARFRTAGQFTRSLPANAVVLAVQDSGAVWFHGSRPTLAWGAIPPDGLDALIARLRGRGYSPVFALEDDEQASFRRRFPTQASALLDWPPFAQTVSAVRVSFFDPAQRASFRAGRAIVTARVR